MIILYMDENVDGAITRGLRLRDIDVLTVQEDEREGITDPEVLERATELGRVLFTQDKDFFTEAHYRQMVGQSFSGVIYAPQDKATLGQCIADLELLVLAGLPEDFANLVRYLPL